MEETNALSAFNQLIMPTNVDISPTKQSPMIDHEKLLEIVRNALQQSQNQLPPQQPPPSQQSSFPTQTLPQMPVVIQTSPSTESDQTLKASPSASSDMSSQDGDISDQQQSLMMMMNQHQQQQQHQYPMGFQNPLEQLVVGSPAYLAANLTNDLYKEKLGRHETWQECFTTTKVSEYEALLFSVYVVERSDRKFDGWTYFDCLHRLQSKCRYRVRTRKQDEFYIIEEKCVHNHGAVEPVGQAGSHAGLPKTIREIVDRSYNENWTLEQRTAKVDEEIRRLGLPENPRLGRQIDNRVAYLRRVKNLNDSRRILDQVNGMNTSTIKDSNMSISDQNLLSEAMLQALMDQNGGSLTVEQGVVEQLLASQAKLASNQEGQEKMTENKSGEEKVVKPMAMNPTPEFYQQFLQQQQQQQQMSNGASELQQQQQQQHAALLAQVQQSLMGGQENFPQ